MNLRSCARVFVIVLLFCTIATSNAQLLGRLKGGSKPPEVSGKAPEYSEADKQLLAEIAQRTTVQQRIQARWDDLRRNQLDYVYAINRTAEWGITEDAFREEENGNLSRRERLYSNPMTQSYISIIGQRLVPKDSPNLYAFRILYDPIPKAEAFTTGTIYISTGLLSLLDNEAQLSYILAHEVAHVERKHQFNRIRNEILEEELYKEKQAKADRDKAKLGAITAVAGGLIGGLAQGSSGALMGLAAGATAGYIAGHFLYRNKMVLTEWSTVEEDEADDLGLQYVLQQNYDVREVPRLFASIDKIVATDPRLSLGFLGSPRRVKERIAHFQTQLNGPLNENIEKLIKGGHLVGSGPNFAVLLSTAKRDNGILAMQYDLFAMARQNLEEAITQRSNDPSTYFYLARLLTQTARTAEDKHLALTSIASALRLDTSRGAIPDLHLENALALLQQDNAANRDQIIRELETYVTLYQRDSGGRLPGNMFAIFDYLNLVGEGNWYLPPNWYTQTMLNSPSNSATIAPEPIIRKAVPTMAVTTNPEQHETKSPAIKSHRQ